MLLIRYVTDNLSWQQDEEIITYTNVLKTTTERQLKQTCNVHGIIVKKKTVSVKHTRVLEFKYVYIYGQYQLKSIQNNTQDLNTSVSKR